LRDEPSIDPTASEGSPNGLEVGLTLSPFTLQPSFSFFSFCESFYFLPEYEVLSLFTAVLPSVMKKFWRKVTSRETSLGEDGRAAAHFSDPVAAAHSEPAQPQTPTSPSNPVASLENAQDNTPAAHMLAADDATGIKIWKEPGPPAHSAVE
jgi:hypothetical protein